jgi:hypothetical protein
MSTIFNTVFNINGVVDTNKNVYDNLQTLCSAAASWLTFDVNTGKWSVIINRPYTPYGSIAASFDDSNIIGSINVSGSGITELYNKVEFTYPNKDILDQRDTVVFEIPSGSLFPNEPLNVLQFSNECVSDPMQAEILAAIELKQSRVDKIIQFRTDFSSIGVKAGDVIEVTNSIYSYTDKLFRILSVEEQDDDDGNLVLSITAFEYDADVYSTTGLTRPARTPVNEIVSQCANEAIQNSEQKATSANLFPLLLANAAASLLNGGGLSKLFEFITERNPETGEITQTVKSKINEGLVIPSNVTITGPNIACEGSSITLTVSVPCCLDNGSKIPYTITGTVSADDINIPLEGELTFTNRQAELPITFVADMITEGTETLILNVFCSSHTVSVRDTYKDEATYTLNASAATVSECQTVTFTLSNVSNHDNGDAIPYTITGITLDDLQSPGSLTGSFIANWCDGASDSITLVFNPDADLGFEYVTLSLDNGAASATVELTDGASYSLSALPAEITEGESTTITLNTVGIPNGVAVPYAITGSATSKITTPLTGTITVSGSSSAASGTLSISTTDDTIDDGVSTQFTITVGPTPVYGTCSGSLQVTVLDNDAPATQCEYVSVPVVWCGQYDGTDEQMTGMTAKKYMNLPVPLAGESSIAVPTAVSVTKGNPSTVTVTSTTNVATSSALGGVPINVITSFNSVGPKGLITGTTTTIYGYSD